MGKYYLSAFNRVIFERRAEISFISGPPKGGYFRLYNKNGGRTTYVRPVDQVPNRAVWIVEAEEPIDPYFSSILEEVEE